MNAELHLLGVVATIRTAVLAEAYAPIDIFTKERKAIEEALEIAVNELGEHVSARARIREGIPAEQIATYAREIDTDLVVIGHSDKGLLLRLFEGSTGTKLIRDLPCSLLVSTVT